jgi:hypothetical protein
MPRIPIVGRRVGAFGLALTAWDVWRRIPPKQRRQLMDQARVHGPRIAKQAIAARNARKRRP